MIVQDTKIFCPVCDTEYKLSEIEEPTECEQCGHYWIAIPKELKENKDYDKLPTWKGGV